MWSSLTSPIVRCHSLLTPCSIRSIQIENRTAKWMEFPCNKQNWFSLFCVAGRNYVQLAVTWVSQNYRRPLHFLSYQGLTFPDSVGYMTGIIRTHHDPIVTIKSIRGIVCDYEWKKSCCIWETSVGDHNNYVHWAQKHWFVWRATLRIISEYWESSKISRDLRSAPLIYWGYAVAQLVEALRYKLEGRGFDSRWSHWNFSVT